MEVMEEDVFFADLSKRISLLIMDDDEGPLPQYPSVSFQVSISFHLLVRHKRNWCSWHSLKKFIQPHNHKASMSKLTEGKAKEREFSSHVRHIQEGRASKEDTIQPTRSSKSSTLMTTQEGFLT
ncbi:hypothetical protein RJ640_028907 [Escallonia rubra]|uniref:Uncharacterized protein n=1 Tax=Escallonia rubra TaxID=112253 RepID=A0AA88QES7_9ASTE|nr:hypothetical protein RJ640_028907 [Escallonia rubra]